MTCGKTLHFCTPWRDMGTHGTLTRWDRQLSSETPLGRELGQFLRATCDYSEGEPWLSLAPVFSSAV